jgi:hypothetical protein
MRKWLKSCTLPSLQKAREPEPVNLLARRGIAAALFTCSQGMKIFRPVWLSFEANEKFDQSTRRGFYQIRTSPQIWTESFHPL